MALGTVTKIMENGVNLLVEVNIGGALYLVTVDKLSFDVLPTALAKQNFIISILASARRSGRSYENTFTTLIGSVITIPD